MLNKYRLLKKNRAAPLENPTSMKIHDDGPGFRDTATCDICNRQRDLSVRLVLSGRKYVHRDLSNIQENTAEEKVLLVGRHCSYRAEKFHEIR